MRWTDADGKRKAKSVFYATEPEAHTARPMIAARYAPGAIDRADDMTFASYLAVWLDDKKRTWKPGTYRAQETYVRVHILGEVSRLGSIGLRSLSERDVKRFLDALQAREVGASTRAAVLTTLSLRLVTQ